jgi:hypothetical protein
MIKIRPYQITDRFAFENLIKENFEEKKAAPPNSERISETICFYMSFSQCGKIYLVTYNGEPAGYFIAENQWNIYEAKISINIREYFVAKPYRKYKPEVKMIEYILQHEKICGIKIKIEKNISKKIFKFFNFERDFGPYLYKKIDVE